METPVRKLSLRTVEDKELRQDLQSFQEKALELGASTAEVIPASEVVVQERVWMKCLVPRCGSAGLSPNCPPNTPQPVWTVPEPLPLEAIRPKGAFSSTSDTLPSFR